jgi:ribokinase
VNAAPARPLPLEADLVVANGYEAEVVGEQPLPAVTMGAEGALLIDHGKEIARARPPRVVAVDGTAAGDAFTACLAVSLLEGREPEEALRRDARQTRSPRRSSGRSPHCRAQTT